MATDEGEVERYKERIRRLFQGGVIRPNCPDWKKTSRGGGLTKEEGQFNKMAPRERWTRRWVSNKNFRRTRGEEIELPEIEKTKGGNVKENPYLSFEQVKSLKTRRKKGKGLGPKI